MWRDLIGGLKVEPPVKRMQNLLARPLVLQIDGFYL
jgi:hypothetical protein